MTEEIDRMLEDTQVLVRNIEDILYKKFLKTTLTGSHADDDRSPSAVLLLLGLTQQYDIGVNPAPCIILNKRSQSIRQAGDLCCPGGSISKPLDLLLQKFLRLPGFPLFRSHYNTDRSSRVYRDMELYLATSLRESFEEMRLNPFSIKFLGPLPPQNLRVFQNIIYPMVGWIEGNQRFKINHEVEKVVFIPLRELFDPANYARYELRYPPPSKNKDKLETQHFPCFLFAQENELLWGATYRIVTRFLEAVFDFQPPELNSLPTVSGSLDKNYFTGSP
jgi:hypothetical protein